VGISGRVMFLGMDAEGLEDITRPEFELSEVYSVDDYESSARSRSP